MKGDPSDWSRPSRRSRNQPAILGFCWLVNTFVFCISFFCILYFWFDFYLYFCHFYFILVLVFLSLIFHTWLLLDGEHFAFLFGFVLVFLSLLFMHFYQNGWFGFWWLFISKLFLRVLKLELCPLLKSSLNMAPVQNCNKLWAKRFLSPPRF